MQASWSLGSLGHQIQGLWYKTAERNINNLRYADDTTLMAESEEELKSLMMKEESEKVGLKLNIQKTKIMASLYSQQKQDWELTVAQIINSLLPN